VFDTGADCGQEVLHRERGRLTSVPVLPEKQEDRGALRGSQAEHPRGKKADHREWRPNIPVAL